VCRNMRAFSMPAFTASQRPRPRFFRLVIGYVS
jgi:hypothetical protein